MNLENNKNNVTVIIGNVKYNLATTENEEYIKGLAKYINSKMDELCSEYDTLSKHSTSFLTILSLNIADDLFKQRQIFTKNSKNLDSVKNQNNKLLKEFNILEDKLNNLQNTILERDNFIKKLEENLVFFNEKDTLIVNLEDKLNNFSLEQENTLAEINSKYNNLLLEKDNIIKDLKATHPSNNVEMDNLILNLQANLKEKDTIIENLKDNLNETTTKLSSLDSLEDLELEKDLEILDLQEEIENLKIELKKFR